MYRYIKSSSMPQHEFQKKQPWTSRHYSSKYGSDGKSHPVSTCEFSNGRSAVVFYDEASYIVYDADGSFYDSDACASVPSAKKEATATAFDEYLDYYEFQVR